MNEEFLKYEQVISDLNDKIYILEAQKGVLIKRVKSAELLISQQHQTIKNLNKSTRIVEPELDFTKYLDNNYQD